MNPLLHCDRIGAPVVDLGESTLNVVVEPRRNREPVVIGLVVSRIGGYDDAEQPRACAELRLPNARTDFPVNVLPLPRLRSNQNHCHC